MPNCSQPLHCEAGNADGRLQFWLLSKSLCNTATLEAAEHAKNPQCLPQLICPDVDTDYCAKNAKSKPNGHQHAAVFREHGVLQAEREAEHTGSGVLPAGCGAAKSDRSRRPGQADAETEHGTVWPGLELNE